MEYLPVGKRTRSQRAKLLMEQNKRARLAAKREWKKKKDGIFEGKIGINDEKLMEGSEAMVIDEEEFLKGVHKFNESEKNSQIHDLGCVKKEVFDDDHGKGVMMMDDVNDGESDDSLKILGERWNPLGLDCDNDDDDDVEDVHDDGCHPLDVKISHDDDEMKGDEVREGGNCEEKDDDFEGLSSEEDDVEMDKDFVGKEDESSSSSDEYSSSECSVIEVDENDDVLLHYYDDDDDGIDELSDNDDDDKRKDRNCDSELKKSVSIEKEEEEVGKIKGQVSGEMRKRGRPRKYNNTAEAEAKVESLPMNKSGKNTAEVEYQPMNKNVKNRVELESPSIKNRVKKSTKDNELQISILNSILEGRDKGIDENLADTSDYYLPLKFKFGVEKLVVHEKSEDELEIESLFNDLDYSLRACNIGADKSTVYNNNVDSEDVPSNDAISQEELCAKGKHYLIHDDEIGVICKFCSYVHLEIKHVMPDFNKDPFGRGNRRDYGRFMYDNSMACDGFQFQDSSYDRQGDHFSPSDDIQGTVWDLVPGVKRSLYPHQRDGFEFIWKNIAGGIKIDELVEPTAASGLGGCIICHAPGTGKTRLAVVFVQSFMKQYQMANPLIIAPCVMLRAWEEEFARWKVDIPFFNLNENELSGKEDPEILTYARDIKNDKTIRFIKLSTWALGKGVLGVSYTLFGKLAGEEGTNKEVREILLTKPGILVLDEGHIPRNEKSNIWNVLSQISTKRRVILSGTPFQNNFEELHNTIALVREEIGSPILSAYYEQDDRRIEELKKRITPFVHVHKGEILRERLKGLFHSLVMLKPSNLQKRCFQHLSGRRLNRFLYDNLVSITSVHPSIFCDENVKTPNFVNDALMDLLKKHITDLDAGVKTRFLVELIKLSKGEKVLVFGQYIPPLNFIADLLKAAFGWNMGSELLYMHGKQDMKERQSMIRLFNDPGSEARVLLASIKACGEGIHLVGASRVVLLDVVWNPSVERQAISRAYRLGQERDVFVYHLITSETREEDKYQRQATKERLSELMFSSEESVEKVNTSSRISEDRVLEEMILHEKTKPMFAKVIYHPKADNLIESFSMDS
ncbi:SNF2 domain-containing protein CLASSY 4-like [Chenopodium quinoa]|uniref:Uncharacterized protein n=1 Tax=Chenopodium quinoa TaxID=63459 RepID=A0A803LUB4_CHEQI|nr:SNF2 domain-containing protein CLASSY 4-like [Chenopodium quinoa]